ncbi:hypothetical protein Mal52_05740 [Symmachiella dynata]|uniref:Uncharacterized protein n=1 Tax=Symmachiella dynata TaxID=2527995 RepID=A0A517ZI46_9PLAN|nr:hypothetical protein [Symmachiella dynata]QDU42119.1 hypothetical protein Mal52_05740 [Symmachiella dynata]
MSIRALLVLALAVYSPLELLSADEPPKVPPSPTVGSVYGKAVTAADIGLTAPIDPTVQFDARDTARWKLMGRIITAFGVPVVERFVKKQKINATAAEIEKFELNLQKFNERSLRQWEARLLELQKELAAPNLSNENKAKLKKEQAMYETIVASIRELPKADKPNSIARHFIVAWKTERELHRMYGGRVIFQQAGLEALDGRRRLFEQAEKNGDIKFDDAGVRHLFYYYYADMKHTVVDEKGFEQPWFFGDGD